MATKYPFTPDGVQQKQAELYKLPDDQLLTQAQSIACGGLLPWLQDNFQLTDDQTAYLRAVPANMMFAWGTQISSTVIGRGNITMDAPPADVAASKAANSSKSTSVSVGGSATINPVTGQTTYTVTTTITFKRG